MNKDGVDLFFFYENFFIQQNQKYFVRKRSLILMHGKSMKILTGAILRIKIGSLLDHKWKCNEIYFFFQHKLFCIFTSISRNYLHEMKISKYKDTHQHSQVESSLEEV